MEVVTRDDPEEEYGILPGDANRTAVGKIVAMDNQHAGPVLRSFGKEFDFMIVEKGDHGRKGIMGERMDLGKDRFWRISWTGIRTGILRIRFALPKRGLNT